tara:strand:- start:43 stop:1164 length:1122 start_codon:yes stop_codon:yes gene_type:complete
MSGYIGTQPVPQATQTRDSFTATSGQTSFATGGYTPQFLDVYLNGIFLANGADYTAANGSDVLLTAGAATGDILEVVAYTTFEISGVAGLTPSIDDNGNATAITIDSSENVLVGKTSTGISAAGHSYKADGTWEVRRDLGTANSSSVGYLSRGTTDGNILTFYKDTTAVGSIQSRAGLVSTLILDPRTGGAGLTSGGNVIIPTDNAGAPSDALCTLGSSGNRYNNLYLGGGVYLGGTGAANKLDDVETGTFTPAFQSITNPTYVAQTGYYIKIGSFVSYQYRIEWSAGTSIGSTVNGLPFAARNGQDEYPMTSNVYHDQSVTYSSNRTTAIGYVLKNTANMDLVCVGSAQTVGTLTFSTSGSIYVTGQYYTNS